MKKEILVSVIIPARNSEKYLGACLRSVLAQDFENFEVIAVDNNSTDGTKEIISGLAEKHQNLKYVFEPKIGRGAARNTGEKQAKGEVILMTDSDCVAPKGWVRAMAGPILAKEAVAVQGGEIGLKQNFWSRQADLRAEERFEAFKRGDRMVMVDTKNFAIGRQFLEKLGFSSRSFARGNDTDLAIRLLKKEIIPVIKNDIRVAHEHCDNFLAVARKYFWGGFWCQKITTAHHFFLRQTNFLKETEQARKPIRESLSNLRATIFDKGFGYLLFDLVTGVAWRFGLARSRRKSAPVLGKKCERSFDESITVLVPVRNRYDYRIKNCLKSLRGQSHKQSLLKIIIIDYGSEKRHKNFFGGLCEEFNARGIWTGRKNEVWNKSKCLNLGLREVKSKYVLVADVDVVLERSYLETCVSIAGEFKDGVGLYPGILDCSKGAVDSGTDVVGNFNRLVKQSTYRGDKYEGHFPYGVGILFTETEILKQLGGYDEFYESWGSEDLDMMNRLQNSGVEILNVSNYTQAIHQWHEKNEGVSNDSNLSRRIKLNQQYYENNFSVVRNNSKLAAKSPKSLPGEFWGITSFFNPAGYKNKYENYLVFREESRRQGLKLVAVELVFDGGEFELKDSDAEIVVRIRGGRENIMWQKEALLNVGLKHLPGGCDKFAWVDCDIIFSDNDWIRKTSELLEQYKVVQPFERVVRMESGVKKIEEHKAGEASKKPVEPSLSFALAWKLKTNEMVSGDFTKYEPGFVCAARREVMDKIGFYDRAITGAADSVMIRAFCGWRHFTNLNGLSEGLIKRQDRWSLLAYKEVQNSIYFIPGDIFHLWHGTIPERRYSYRDNILRVRNFDPNFDVTINRDGILEWTTHDEEVKAGLREYFWVRNEEGKLKSVAPSRIESARKPRARLKMRLFWRQAKIVASFDLGDGYFRLLGLVGQKIKGNNQGLYLSLKRYFPDKN